MGICIAATFIVTITLFFFDTRLSLEVVFKAEEIVSGCMMEAKEEVSCVSFSLLLCLPYVSEHSSGTVTVGADVYTKL